MSLVPGLVVEVTEGATLADRFFHLTTNAPIVVGTTALAFTAFTGGGLVPAHAASHVGVDAIQSATAGQIGLMTVAYAGKLDGIEALADVTDETNVTAAHPISDATALVKDPVSPTKQARLDVGAVTAGQTRTVTVPDQDVDLTPGTGAFAAAGAAPTAHAASHVGADAIQSATSAQPGLMSAAQAYALDLPDDFPTTTGFVYGIGAELQVEQTAVASMTVRVIAANAGKRARGTDGSYLTANAGELTVALAASDPANPRYDVISLRSTGVLRATTGTPAALPVEPAVPAGDCKLAVVRVNAAAVSVANAVIFTHRYGEGKTVYETTDLGPVVILAASRRVWLSPWTVLGKIWAYADTGLMVPNALLSACLYGAGAWFYYNPTNDVEQPGTTVTFGAAAPGAGGFFVKWMA